jgi:L-2-hydroxycarboxylate dehydrogenase (NAD+)
MLVTLARLYALMVDACRAAQVPDDAAEEVVTHYLEGEARGKPSHGVAKFCFECRFFADRQGAPELVREHGALAIVDAHRELGPISARFAVDLAMDKARQHGVGIVGIINTQRYGILGPWSERIARAGFVGLAMNTSPAEATPCGGRTPVLGVNPLSIAFPTLGEPFVADMSTTLAPMGVLWEARRSGAELPGGCFVDSEGEFTTDPHTATSAVMFGEHRGFVVSLLVQILTGSLFGFPMGEDVDSVWRTGYAFLALDPSFAGTLPGAAASNASLVAAMTDALTRDGGRLRIPGHVSTARRAQTYETGAVDLPDEVYQRLRVRAAGDFQSD